MPNATPAAAGASSTSGAGNAVTSAVAANVALSTEKIAEVLTQLYGDSGMAGGAVAAQQLGQAGGDFAELIPTINWSTWKPGDPETAGLLANGGLRRILNAIDIRIKELNNSVLDRLGNVLAEGIARGDPNQTIARDMADIIADPKRAMVIARTEVARAMGASTMDTFMTEDIDEWTWNTTEGACIVCLKYEAEGPYEVGSGPLFPGHPNCRCDPRAVLDIDTSKGIVHDVSGEMRDIRGEWRSGNDGSSWKPTMSAKEADAWAKGSAVQATVYHGTSAGNVKDIESHGFDLGKAGSATGMLQGKGVYLSGDKDAAEGFAAGKDGKQTPGVLSLKVNVKHPASTKESFDIIKQAESENGGPYGNKFGDRVAELAHERGFDSFDISYGNMAWIMKTGMAQWDGVGPKPTEADLIHEYIVFDPKNITVVK